VDHNRTVRAVIPPTPAAILKDRNYDRHIGNHVDAYSVLQSRLACASG